MLNNAYVRMFMYVCARCACVRVCMLVSMYDLSVCIADGLSISLYVCTSLGAPVCKCIYVSMSVYPSVYVPISEFIYVHNMPVWLPT